LSDEDREAAERAASGEPEDDGIVAEAPNAEQAADLQRQIEEQRALEQKLRKEAVEAAEAAAEAQAAEAARLEEEKAAAAAAAAKAEEE
jgi:hypothetical protein